MISLLLFKVGKHRYAISNEQIYRIERFDPAAVEFSQGIPAFYRVGDYVISLDWLTTEEPDQSGLVQYSRLLLYRSATKIRGIPATELERVHTDPPIKDLSLIPAIFRKSGQLGWVQLFFLHDQVIIPVLKPESLSQHSFRA